MAADPYAAFVQRVTHRIRALRKAHGMTGEEFADTLGIAPQNLRRIERGQNLTLVTLARIADALGYDVRVVFVRRRR